MTIHSPRLTQCTQKAPFGCAKYKGKLFTGVIKAVIHGDPAGIMYNINYDDGAVEDNVLHSSVKASKMQRAQNMKRVRSVSPTF